MEWEDGYAATVVLAAKDYPEHPKTGDVIAGADLDNPDVVLHAGTATKDGEYVSAGGRVLNVLGKGATLQDAVDAAYQAIGQISLEGSFYRKDIGRRAIEGEIRI